MKDSIKYITVYTHATARGRQSIILEETDSKHQDLPKKTKITRFVC